MKYFKYPRTPHLPFSKGATSNDKILKNVSHFDGKDVIVSEKKDGESCTIYSDGKCHARSLDSKAHPSREWVKQFASTISYQMPAGMRICGENLYATHSIEYNDLESYFYAFSVWNDQNMCLSWDESIEWFELLNVTSVPVLFRGVYDSDIIHSISNKIIESGGEGIVVRLAESFSYANFSNAVAKTVRPNHVTTSEHWMHAEMKTNKLKTLNNT